jgi:hypothetical protein
VEQNGGTEWTAGTINFKLYTGGNVIWESGALSLTDMPETSGLTVLTDQRTLWFEGLSIPLSQDTVLRAQFETVGLAGGPEGQAMNIWGVTEDGTYAVPSPLPVVSPYAYLAVIRNGSNLTFGQNTGDGTLLNNTDKTVTAPANGRNLVLEMEASAEFSFAVVAAVGFKLSLDGVIVQESFTETNTVNDRAVVSIRYFTPVTAGQTYALATNIYNTAASNVTIEANSWQVTYKIYEAPPGAVFDV